MNGVQRHARNPRPTAAENWLKGIQDSDGILVRAADTLAILVCPLLNVHTWVGLGPPPRDFGASVDDHASEAEAGREHSRGVDAKGRFAAFREVIAERVIHLLPGGLVGLRRDENGSLDGRVRQWFEEVAVLVALNRSTAGPRRWPEH